VDKTAAKAFVLLEKLAASSMPCGVSELARDLRLAKSNVHRHLSTLVALGYARRTERATYEASLKLWEVGVQVLNRLDLRHIARPTLEWLAAQTDETVHLTIPDQAEIIYIDKIESTHPVREFTRVGSRAPAHCTATGKVLLAFRDGTPSAPLQRFTRHTIKDLRRLKDELARIRKQGYAFNLGEYGAYVNGVAAPIADHSGAVIASVVISGPAERIRIETLKTLMPLVVLAGQTVSIALGYQGQLAGWAEAAKHGPKYAVGGANGTSMGV
jgi:IclR family transcriptional regulator, KDG regulon repressor